MQRGRTVTLFLITTLLMVLPAITLVYGMEKLPLHALINQWHTPVADVFFTYFTHLADGWVPVVLSIALLFLADLRAFLMMGASTLFSALITQGLKRLVFPERDRPFLFQDELGDMSWVIGLDLNHHFSFPSGHATCAFSMCMALTVIIGRSNWAVPLALLAALLSFSRVYLSQHFLEDIAAGALIGSATATIIYLFLYKGGRAANARLNERAFRQNQ